LKKVGIFSGTFDPVHNGHLAFARTALEQCQLDRVYFLVEPRPRRKQGVKAFEHRCNMVQLAIKDDPNLGNIVLEQARFTPHETLPVLQARFKNAELYLLMGDDMLAHILSWPHVDELLSSARFVVAKRQWEVAATKRQLKLIAEVKNITLNYDFIAPAEDSVASSKIRYGLRHGHQPKGLPAAVAEYIEANGLYSPADDDASES